MAHTPLALDVALVRDAMLDHGWTGADLAERIGTSRGYVHDLLKGRRAPSARTLKRLADALGSTPRGLLVQQQTAGT